ncbi:hypothetical protein AB0H43_03145 [Hamadaea sp. NPDC050747]|uniref:hypothetical protein n=1 Tax=Hamadaea sp. NPDC050747 TaxID=3155789 RepID=UPI0033CD408D
METFQRTLKIYLATPPHCANLAAVAAVCAALAVLGCEVALPAAAPEEAAGVEDELLITACDLDALLMADYVVTMPGAERQWEATMAPAYGVPVMSLAKFADLAPTLTR